MLAPPANQTANLFSDLLVHHIGSPTASPKAAQDLTSSGQLPSGALANVSLSSVTDDAVGKNCYPHRFFLIAVNGYFCRGFCKNVVPDRGFLMVNLWWNAGERWSENDLNLPRKICHIFQIYFWAFSFWEMDYLASPTTKEHFS
jgi:hypothetical protein